MVHAVAESGRLGALSLERKLHGGGKPYPEFPCPPHSYRECELGPQFPDQGAHESPDPGRVRQYLQPDPHAGTEHGKSADPGFEERTGDSNRWIRSDSRLFCAEHRTGTSDGRHHTIPREPPGYLDHAVQFLIGIRFPAISLAAFG